MALPETGLEDELSVGPLQVEMRVDEELQCQGRCRGVTGTPGPPHQHCWGATGTARVAAGPGDTQAAPPKQQQRAKSKARLPGPSRPRASASDASAEQIQVV